MNMLMAILGAATTAVNIAVAVNPAVSLVALFNLSIGATTAVCTLYLLVKALRE